MPDTVGSICHAELSATGCQAKDIKDFLRCVVARSSTAASAPAPVASSLAAVQANNRITT